MKSRILASLLVLSAAIGLVGCAASHPAGGGESNESLSLGSCEETLLSQYQKSVYPFFRKGTTCMGCHIEGGVGLGLFASSNLKISYAAFNAAGLTQVSYMAQNPQHKPPYTGSHNKPAMDAITAEWTVDQRQYLDCVSRLENGGSNESLLTSAKAAPTIYTAQNTIEKLTWNLNLASDVDESVSRSVPAKITIDVRVLYQNSEAKGYIFSNPTLQLTDATKQVLVEGIFFQINGQSITSQTTFTNVSRVVTGTLAVPLMNVQANTLIQPITTQDRFQLYVRRIALTSGVGDTLPPQTPILKVTDKETGSGTLVKSTNVGITILRDASIVRWCLTESAAKPASADSPCQNVATGGSGAVNGWQTSRPMAATISAGEGNKTLYLWVANSDLLINDQPAVVTVALDSLAPAAPVIQSILVSDTQVADLLVTHSNQSEVTGWCTIEQNSILPAPTKPKLDDMCWLWADDYAKPTTVGFKGGGSRDVWVYVRDKAGNISAPSNRMTVNNPFGAITFTELTNSVASPRSVFTNRCFTCHSSSTNPGYHALRLFNYEAAIVSADDGILVSRINDAISPMPNVNGGLMPQRERDLIRLWTMPEEGTTPLP